MSKNEEQTVPCTICGAQTRYAGTAMRTGCWEFYSRVHYIKNIAKPSYRAKIATLLLEGLLPDHSTKNIEQRLENLALNAKHDESPTKP